MSNALIRKHMATREAVENPWLMEQLMRALSRDYQQQSMRMAGVLSLQVQRLQLDEAATGIDRSASTMLGLQTLAAERAWTKLPFWFRLRNRRTRAAWEQAYDVDQRQAAREQVANLGRPAGAK